MSVLSGIVSTALQGAQPPYAHMSEEDAELWTLCKAADKLSALIKCVQERETGNREFLQAEEATLQAIHAMQLPEAECFLTEFFPSYTRSIDQQAKFD